MTAEQFSTLDRNDVIAAHSGVTYRVRGRNGDDVRITKAEGNPGPVRDVRAKDAARWALIHNTRQP